MILIPNSWGGDDLREANGCHEPGGRPSGGRFCSKDAAVGPRPKGDMTIEDYDKRRAVEREWERKIAIGVSLGHIEPEDAKALGWDGASNLDNGYAPLPSVLYHVSTAFNDILLQGAKTRDEIGGVHRGLGGGASDTISFTEDLTIARAIRAGLLEARRVVRGELTPHMMLDMLKNQKPSTDPARLADQQRQGNRDAYEMFVSFYKGGEWHRGDAIPENLDRLLRGVKNFSTFGSDEPALKAASKGFGAVPMRLLPAGYHAVATHMGRDEMFADYAERAMTKDEHLDAAFEMFKRFSTAREYGGGRLDPLFFMTDREALAKVKVKDIKIMQFKPARGAKGYKVSSLGEWRVHTGRAVRYTGIAESS